MRRNRRRRVRRNQAIDWMRSVITPVAGGAAGFVAARSLGNMMAMRDLLTTDPKLAKTIAAGVGIPATFMLARRMPGSLISRNQGAIVLGMGLASAEAWLRDTPLLGGSRAAAAVTEDLPPPSNGGALPGTAPEADMPGEMTVVEGGGDGLSSYYAYPTSGGQSLSDDYYTASMLGNTGDPANQSSVDKSLDIMESDVEAVSTVIPTDMALRANSMPQFAPVRERFANRGDRGHAGGVFARHLFSGMMGS